ncbi:MAG: RluA family pseudouridine synthase [Lachnospiraceae bacterium]|nr:RluA family pseudouridine synthase [Lachnospiraceae bacterium]
MILYEDKEILVCHKPAGVPVQSASVREKDMVSILKCHRKDEIYVVHRLDQPVEGVLVFAKTKRAAADLSRQIADGSMKKLYRAVVSSDVAPYSGTDEWHTLVDYLVKDGRRNLSCVSDAGNKAAKRAELRYRILGCRKESIVGSTPVRTRQGIRVDTDADERGTSSEREFLLVEIELKTGRHHQIRVQMAHAGLPLAGDRKYNPHGEEDATSLALCAVSLSFRHPASGKAMRFETKPQAERFLSFTI